MGEFLIMDMVYSDEKGKYLLPADMPKLTTSRDGLRLNVNNVRIRPSDKSEYVYVLSYVLNFNGLAQDSESVETELLELAKGHIAVQVATAIRRELREAENHDTCAESWHDRVINVADLDNELEKSGRGPVDPAKGAVRQLSKMDDEDAIELLANVLRSKGIPEDAIAAMLAAQRE